MDQPWLPIRLLRLSDANEYKELSERTRNSILSSDWVEQFSCSLNAPCVYVCEAFGGADVTELIAVFQSISRRGESVLLHWTDDYLFEAVPNADVLIFQTNGSGELSTGYCWDVNSIGPHLIDLWKPFEQRRYIASFIGARGTHLCREALFQPTLSAAADFYIKDRSWWDLLKSPETADERPVVAQEYRAVLAESKFALCPRGNGPSSIRRWEAVYSGAIPILIDDLTDPHRVCLPCIRISSAECSERELAERIHQEIKAVEANGATWQRQLATILKRRLDPLLLSAHHTFVCPLVATAVAHWQGENGFGNRMPCSV